MDETIREILERRMEEMESEINRLTDEIAYKEDLLRRKMSEALEMIEGIERSLSLTMSSRDGGVRDALCKKL